MLVLILGIMPSTTLANPPTGGETLTTIQPDKISNKSDYRTDPLTDRQKRLREKALKAKLHGKANGKTYQVARGQYVELAREGESAVWLVQFRCATITSSSLRIAMRSTGM